MKLIDSIRSLFAQVGATLTTLDDEPFAIFDGHDQVGAFNDAINELLTPQLWAYWRPIYQALDTLRGAVNPYRRSRPFSDLRLGKIDLAYMYDDNWRLRYNVKYLDAYYTVKAAVEENPFMAGFSLTVPDGLYNLDSDNIVEWGFNDTYSTCSECGRAIRTQPDGYGWQLEAWKHAHIGDLVCGACIQEHELQEEYIEDFVNKPRLINTDLADIESYGWVQVDIEFENGLHRGQNADPNAIIRLLGQLDIPVLFTGSDSQFTTDFYVWVPYQSHAHALAILTHEENKPMGERGTRLPYDPATEFEKVLKGGVSPYVAAHEYHITPDGLEEVPDEE